MKLSGESRGTARAVPLPARPPASAACPPANVRGLIHFGICAAKTDAWQKTASARRAKPGGIILRDVPAEIILRLVQNNPCDVSWAMAGLAFKVADGNVLFRVVCSFNDFDFVRRQAVKLINERVNLAIKRGAFVFVKILVLVALRPLARCGLVANILLHQ